MGYQYNGLCTTQYVLKIIYKLAEQQEEHCIQLFVKAINESNKFLTLLTNEMQAFQKEDFFYAKLNPLLEASGLRYSCVPEYYLSDYPLIVMEDLALSSYHPFKKTKPLDLYQCKKCLEVLAIFHSKPMIYQLRKSRDLGRIYRLTEDYGEILENKFTSSKNVYSVEYYTSSIEALLGLASSLPENGIDKIQFKKKLLEAFEVFGDNNYTNELALTILHGDVWSTNFLHKLKDGKIEDCKIIDFQTVYFGPPGKDVVQFALTNTSVSFYKQHKEELLNYYYQYFCEVAENYMIQPSELLPEKEFNESCDKFELGAKLFAAVDHSLTCLPDNILSHCTLPENFEDFLFGDKLKYLTEAFVNDDSYRDLISKDLYDLVNMVKTK